jgi:MFS transporter, DHA2 family, multidrug resistance protein
VEAIAMIRDIGARKWWALAALTVAVLAAGLGLTILSVALPTLAKAFSASTDQLQWFVAANGLGLAAGMLPAGLLGDRLGHTKVMVGGLVLFAAGAIAAAYAPTPEAFVAAQAVLGIAAALVIVQSLAGLTVLFSDEERPRAFGIWAAANFLGFPIGPVLGGWLLTNFWWGWAFLMNIPVIVVAIAAVIAWLPETRSDTRPSIDVAGLLVSSAGLVVLFYGLIQAGLYGWGDRNALLPLAAALLLLAVFFTLEIRLGRGGAQPLIDLELLRSGVFTSGTTLAAAGIFALFGVLFVLPQYYQAIVGLDPQGAGVRLLPLIGGILIGAVTADKLERALGLKLSVALGFLVTAAAMIVGATTTAASDELFVAAWVAASGLGMGIGLATAASAALGQLSPERSGVGSALMQAVQKLGGALGPAILGSALNSSYRDSLVLTGLPAQAATAVQKGVFAGVAVAHQLKSTALLENVDQAFYRAMSSELLLAAGVAGTAIVFALAFLPWRSAAAAGTKSLRTERASVA